MGKTKVECKKLDYLSETQKCVFCGTSEIDEIKYGPVYSHKNVITHYYCLLLSSNMEQNGRDCDGILGFLPNDILREVKRGGRLHCSYCRTSGATLGCAVTKCKVVFHLPCGIKHSTLHQFFGEFKSFCNKHRPVQIISEKILANSNKGAICGICYDKVVPRPVHETLWAPCCQKNAFFHRACVQRLAISAGYFFKCPLCNNTTLFTQTMKEYGIYIPEQDASWECVPHAYQDLLVRHDTCDSANCSCPEGRKTNVPGTRWELILCKYCGSQGIHIGCGRLKWKSPEFECDICSKAAPQEGNTRNNGSRHRLLGSNRSTHVPTSIPAVGDKEESDESSDDSTALTISNRRMRIRSPVPELRPKTPPLRKAIKKHRHERHERSHEYENRHDRERKNENNSSILIDDDIEEKVLSRSILIDDSDDDVEFVTEPKYDFNQHNSTSLKSFDGKTIPVVRMDSKDGQARKRFRAVGDIDVDSAEVVDISIQMPGPLKKPKIQSPLPIKELVYTFPQLQPQPQPSSSHSVPSTSFAPPDFSRYVLVDSSTLRPEDLVPGSVVYRSMQPLAQHSAVQHPPLPQPQPHPQPQPQPTSIPMQQQLGPPCNADAQYSDLGKHWTGGSHHLGSHSPASAPAPAPHVQERAEEAARGTIQCDHTRRRRGRHPRCDNHRLKPQVLISRLRCRITSSGHFEFIVPWENLNSHVFLKKKTSLPSRPMKKIKLSTKKSLSKCNKIAISPSPINTILENPRKRITNTKQKSRSKQIMRVSIQNCIDQEITSYFNPTKLKMNKKKNKKTPKNCNVCSSKRTKKDENYGINVEVIDSTNNVSLKTECKERKTKKRRLSSLDQWKYKTIDHYLKKIEKLSTFQTDINQKVSSGNFVDFEQNKFSLVPMKSEELDDMNAGSNIPKEELLITKVISNETMSSPNNCQTKKKSDEDAFILNCSESSSEHYDKHEPDNVVGSAFISSDTESVVSEDRINNGMVLVQTFANKTNQSEIHSGLSSTESTFKASKELDPHKFETPCLNLSKMGFNTCLDKPVRSEHENNINSTTSINISLGDVPSLANANCRVLPTELLEHGCGCVDVNSRDSLPPESSEPGPTNSNQPTHGNSPWSWTESTSTLSNALQIEISLGEGTHLPTDSKLEHSMGPMNGPAEPSTSNVIKSFDINHSLVSNEVNSYKDAINKETENGFLQNNNGILNSNVGHVLLDGTLPNKNHKPDFLQLRHSSAEQGSTTSSCKDASSRPCDDVCQDRNLTVDEIPSQEDGSRELSGKALPRVTKGNNYEKQVNNNLSFKNQGFFPRIKIVKSTKSNLSNKKSIINSETKAKSLNKDKRGKKRYKENVKEKQIKPQNKMYFNKGMYNLDRFFKKEPSSITKSVELTASNRSGDCEAFLPPLPSRTTDTTVVVAEQPASALYELNLNRISNIC